METTANIDIRRLEVLSDRIAQTIDALIDALSQVRLSVHGVGTAVVPLQNVRGIQHTSLLGYPMAFTSPYVALHVAQSFPFVQMPPFRVYR